MTHDGPTLSVDLDALARNYRLLCQTFSGPNCAAVVKADGYGLGAIPVAKQLLKEGCHHFFVATLDEAIALRSALPTSAIYVFHGVGRNEEKEFIAHRLIPVLNDLVQMERWAAGSQGLPSALHVDTGMGRLGLSEHEATVFATSSAYARCQVQLLMSHLACANEPDNTMNARQHSVFSRVRQHFPNIACSLVNSSGVFLSQEFHFDLGRPGCALYGITPRGDQDNPMEHVATLRAPVIQERHVTHETTVGYGSLYTAPAGARLATLALGYADGYFRLLTGKGKAFIHGTEVPIVGRVSMDTVIADVSHLPDGSVIPGTQAEFICTQLDVNRVAALAGTIGYEIFTRLGNRVRRIYSEHGQQG